MRVSITKNSLAVALLYIEQSAKNITVTRHNGAWTITANY
jgi:hypothetical protein